MPKKKSLLTRILDDIEDVFTFVGLALMGTGSAMIYLPAGFIVVGFGLFGIGLKWLLRLSELDQDRIRQIEEEKEEP